MQAFDYEALDKAGKRKRGTIMAPTARAARREIRAQNLVPVQIKDAKILNKAKSGGTNSARVSTKDLTQATRQLAILVRSGTPVSEALQIAANQSPSAPLRTHLLAVRSRVLEGRKLSNALRERPKVFSPLYASLVEAGENSGQLGAVLDRLATDMESAQKVKNKVIGATIYPIVLCIVAIAVIVILMIFVVPKVVAQFESFDQDLPALTQGAIAVSDFIKSFGIFVLLAFIAFGFGFRLALKLPTLRKWNDATLLKLPIIGRLIRNMNAARFARTMSGLLASGIPVMQALAISKNTLGNVILRNAIDTVEEAVRGGGALGLAVQKTGVFPPLMGHMIAAGETSGDISQMFNVTAEYLEGEFDRSTQVLLSLFEPAIIILLGGMVLLIVAAIFMPILKLNTLSF